MRIGVVKEARPGERRVAILPESVRKMLSLGRGSASSDDAASTQPVSIVVETGAGASAGADDASYKDAGAEISPDAQGAWSADLVLCVNPPTPDQIGLMREGAALLGVLQPTEHADLVRALLERRISALSFDAVPRITRAQKVDVLSSMSTVAGYRAVLIGAEACPKFFPMLMTAAGTITPSRVLVIGAGVAGLQAIATAHRLGAVVESYDLRPAVKEQVESLGARFVELPMETGGAETSGGYAKEQSQEQQRKQNELMVDHVVNADVVITTALIPGKPAPMLIDAATVRRMKPGAIIVDLAAAAGGNCELTQADQRIVDSGVTILGPTNLPSELPIHASQMFSRNATAFVQDLAPKGELHINLDDEVIHGALITHRGQTLHEPTRQSLTTMEASA